MAISITACDSKEKDSSQANTTLQAQIQNDDSQGEPIAKLKSEDFPLPEYDKGIIYGENEFVGVNPVTGPIEPFDNSFFYAILNDGDSNYVDGLYKLEILKVYDIKEEETLAGYNPDGIDFSFGFYDCKVLYDYTRNKPMQNQIVTVRLMSDNSNLYERLPSYQVGDKVATALRKPDTGFAYIKAVLYDIEVIEYDGVDVGYVRNAWHDPFNAFDLGLLEGENSRITTCANNPAVYYQKVLMTDVAEFSVKDWTEHGVFDVNAETWIDKLPSHIEEDISESTVTEITLPDESINEETTTELTT